LDKDILDTNNSKRCEIFEVMLDKRKELNYYLFEFLSKIKQKKEKLKNIRDINNNNIFTDSIQTNNTMHILDKKMILKQTSNNGVSKLWNGFTNKLRNGCSNLWNEFTNKLGNGCNKLRNLFRSNDQLIQRRNTDSNKTSQYYDKRMCVRESNQDYKGNCIQDHQYIDQNSNNNHTSSNNNSIKFMNQDCSFNIDSIKDSFVEAQEKRRASETITSRNLL
jgi:hypothetical protein